MKRCVPERQPGWTRLDLLTVAAIAGVLTLVLLPVVLPPRAKYKRANCVNNLKQVGLAFHLWAADHGNRFPMAVSVTNGGTKEYVPTRDVFRHFQVTSNEVSTPKVLVCPRDFERTNARNFTADFGNGRVSYFVGVDAGLGQPDRLLSGDRNLMMGGVPLPTGLAMLGPQAPLTWSSAVHSNAGNLLFADGRVEQPAGGHLRERLERAGVTNRLAVP